MKTKGKHKWIWILVFLNERVMEAISLLFTSCWWSCKFDPEHNICKLDPAHNIFYPDTTVLQFSKLIDSTEMVRHPEYNIMSIQSDRCQMGANLVFFSFTILLLFITVSWIYSLKRVNKYFAFIEVGCWLCGCAIFCSNIKLKVIRGMVFNVILIFSCQGELLLSTGSMFWLVWELTSMLLTIHHSCKTHK